MTTSLPAATPRGVRWLRRLFYAAVVLAVLFAGYLLIGWPWFSRWGASAEEARKPLPGDELVAGAPLQTTRAITIRASAAEIYPWLLQMGVDRGGLYTYDWLENLFGLRVKNADRVHAEWQNTQPGDFIRYTPRDYALNPGPGMWVVAMDPDRTLVTCNGLENEMPATCPASISYILEEQADGTTRMIIRGRSAGGTLAKAWQAIPFIMERGQLLGLRRAVETSLGR